MCMMEFYTNPAHQSVKPKEIVISFPTDEQFVDKKIAGLGGVFLERAEGRGKILIPETRITAMQKAFPHYIISDL